MVHRNPHPAPPHPSVTRDAAGRLLKGSKNALKQRKPQSVRMDQERARLYLDAMSSVVSPEDWKDVTREALKDARGNDPKVKGQARQWLSDHVIPDPAGLIAGTGGGTAPVTVLVLDYDASTDTASVRPLLPAPVSDVEAEAVGDGAGGDGGTGRAAGPVEGAPAPAPDAAGQHKP